MITYFITLLQILTLSKWKQNNEVLLRFQHIFDKA